MGMATKTILTSNDVPQYIREIAARLVPDKSCQDGVWGFNFRLYAKWPRGYITQLMNDCDKLLAWCRRHYAEAELVKRCIWYDVHPDWNFQTAERRKFHNYVVVTITDPVARRFENDHFYKGVNEK